MDVTLVGANKNAAVVFEEPTGYYENYYLAHTGENGLVAKGYSKMTYKNVYPNIDWVIYTPPAPLKGSDETIFGASGPTPTPPKRGSYNSSPSGEVGRGVKYDFIIHPGGNPADIRLRYDGATELKLVEGALVAVTPYGTITEDAPYSYNAETKTEVASTYILQGNELRFDVGQYEGTLVIDPALNWATYYGGMSSERDVSSAVDTAGSVYMSGYTQSPGNIATTGAHQTVYATSTDGFIVKFSMSGSRVWATYYGGIGTDDLNDIATDHLGNVYTCGSTNSSTGIATNGAFQSSLASSAYDMMLVKLNAATGSRVWATYYGGTGVEDETTVSCDATGNVYMAGGTSSSGMATNGAFLTTPDAGLLAAFNGSGQRLWSTYYYSDVQSIHYDAVGGFIYICGFTTAISGIVTTGAYQTTFGGGIDGYLAKFTTAGSRLWGTYYGGNGGDLFWGITTDVSGNIYAMGTSASTNGIASTGAHQTVMAGANDGILVKFNAAGQRLWGTYYGGPNGFQSEPMLAATTDPRNNVYVLGFTQSTSGIATGNGYKTALAGAYDAYMAIFNSSGQRQWGSYYGGNNHEDGALAGINYVKGKIYMTISTLSNNGIATTGSYQSSFAGAADAVVVQWDVDTFVYIREPFTDTFHCAGDTLRLPYGVTQNFRSNNTFTVQLSNATGSFATPVNIGSFNTNTAGTFNCLIPVNTPAGAGYKVRMVATGPADTSLPTDYNLRIYPKPANFSAGSNSPVCTGDSLKLNSGTTTAGVTYAWAGPNSYSSATEDPVLPNATLAMPGNYYININNSGCVVKDTVVVVVNQGPENVTASNNSPICTIDTMKLIGSTTTSGVTYAWTGPNNYNTQNVTLPNAQLSDGGTYLFTVTLGNCSDTASTVVTVDQSAVINIVSLTPVSICKGDTAQFYGFPNFAGTNPQMQWQINGVNVPGATAALFKTPILANGDKVRMTVTPNTTCPGTRMSNEIPIIVQDLKAPQVSITADAGPSLFPNEPINFTAVATDAGNAPNYQWRKNGIDIGGATGAVWGANANALKDGDNICVLVTSTYACPSPDTALSNCIQLDIRLSVDDVVNSNSIKVYPNPVKGTLRITSTTTIETITINNLLGQQLLQQTAIGDTADVDMSAFAAGVYVVKVNGVYAVRVTKE